MLNQESSHRNIEALLSENTHLTKEVEELKTLGEMRLRDIQELTLEAEAKDEAIRVMMAALKSISTNQEWDEKTVHVSAARLNLIAKEALQVADEVLKK